MAPPQVPYASPEAMRQAVLAHAGNVARKNSQLSVHELLRRFAYARLLARLFVHEPERWVLKGATGLLARLPSARHSLDVDLWHDVDSLEQAERAVERAAGIDLRDHVRFRVGDWKRHIDANRPLARTSVLCRIGQRPLIPPFGVDIVTGPPPPLSPDAAPPLRPLQLPGLLEPPHIRLFPLACSVADKLAATLTTHGGRPSTRYRDLVDLASIAITQRLAARELYVAIHHELLGQRLPIPDEFGLPDADAWRAGYAKQSAGLPHLRGVGFDEALALVKALLDPVLQGRREGTWRPEARGWESGPDRERDPQGGVVDDDLNEPRPNGNLASVRPQPSRASRDRAAEHQPVSDRPVRRSQLMRALVADPSASPALSLADVPEPSPGPDQLLVRVEATSINRGEIRAAAKQPPGMVIGWDVVGSVVALGDGVRGFEVGERVLSLSPGGGAFAELAAVPVAWTTPLPSAADPVLASTLPVAGLTAMNIVRLARVHAGDRVLITGAAGGVGMLAVQFALDAKATVTGQASSEQRAAAVRELGAEAMIHAGDGSPVEGEFDVVLDSIGGPMLAPLLRATTLAGRVVVFGNSADAESTFRVEEFYPKAITIYGFRVFQSVPPEQGLKDLAMLAELLSEGRIKVAVHATAPLTEALPLVRDLYDRKVTGKVVVTA